MTRLRDNVLANYGGQLWVALLSLVFLPIYVRMLGAEGFGLVGLMFSIQALSVVLDFGMTVFVGREIARRMTSTTSRGGIRHLVRAFEWLVWPTAGVLLVAMWLFGAPLASSWLDASVVGAEIPWAMRWIALAVSLQWPSGFYSAGMYALERQATLNLLLALFATLRFGVVIPVIWLADGSINAFLAWFAIVALLQTATLAWTLHRHLPSATRGETSAFRELRAARGFAGGVFAVTSLGLMLSQADRVAVALYRPLAEFGHYAMVVALAGGLGKLVMPVFNAVFPRMNAYVASGDVVRMDELYRLSTQAVATPVLAAAAVCCVLPEPVLFAWTGDRALASAMATPLAIAFAGTTINALLNIPFALHLAHGRTQLPLYVNLCLLLLVVPVLVIAVPRYGAIAAALAWLSINVGAFVAILPATHRRWLPNHALRRLGTDLIPAAATSVTVALLARWAWPTSPDRLVTAFCLLGIAVATLAATVSTVPGLISLLAGWMRRSRGSD